jgi:hypothetical protein
MKHSSSYQVYWLAFLFELKLGTLRALNCHQEQRDMSATLKPSGMNRLQLSMNAKRLPKHAANSTTGVSTFLSETLDLLTEFLQVRTHVDNDWTVS